MRPIHVLALSLALALPAAAPVAAAAAETPCDPMLLDWLCTVYQAVERTLDDVHVACTPVTCGSPAIPLSMAGPCDNEVERVVCVLTEAVTPLPNPLENACGHWLYRECQLIAQILP